jgi:hypothetical protein
MSPERSVKGRSERTTNKYRPQTGISGLSPEVPTNCRKLRLRNAVNNRIGIEPAHKTQWRRVRHERIADNSSNCFKNEGTLGRCLKRKCDQVTIAKKFGLVRFLNGINVSRNEPKIAYRNGSTSSGVSSEASCLFSDSSGTQTKTRNATAASLG